MRGPPKRSLSSPFRCWAILGDTRQEASCYGRPLVPGPRLESLRVSRPVHVAAERRCWTAVRVGKGPRHVPDRLDGCPCLVGSGQGQGHGSALIPRLHELIETTKLGHCWWSSEGGSPSTADGNQALQMLNHEPMRVAGERSWRLLSPPPRGPPPLLFPLGIVGLPATVSWRAKGSSGSGSGQSDIDISMSPRLFAVGQDCNTASCQLGVPSNPET